MRTREQALKYGLSFPDTYFDAPFHDNNWQLVRFGGNGKAFLWTYERGGFVNLNVKAEPDKARFWRDAYDSVIPGYHQNKEHWNTIILDGSIPEKYIKIMIRDSYRLISDNPSKRIYEAVKKIPCGRVATYAQVAEMAGDRKMARAVGNALHRNPEPGTVPCFRVVNSKGQLSGEFAFGGLGAQARLLEAEGVEVIDGRVDLKKYGMKEIREDDSK
ncbi:MAG: methylated-DNA--[Spirochaetales bacterium]|nr:methylated-DNA--[protein]-cysteine S-methyltransferase [Spirochaetales bacterium]